jgi:UDP-N-acetylmuramoyl-tripeptide--D-alanyl-D-alanine ligase
MPEDTQALIVEMAMRGLGQIDQLARCAVPNIGIITNAGTAHLELLGSVENIARAKCELLANLDKRKALGIIGRPSDHLLAAARQVYSGKLLVCEEDDILVSEVNEELTTFQLKETKENFAVRVHGRPLLEDAWCVINAAREAGIDEAVIKRGLRCFEPVGGRGNRLVAANGALILDETYNANPDSVKASIQAVLDSRAYPQKEKIVVLGVLAELGPAEAELHHELGSWLKDKPLKALITVGSLARNIAEGAQGARFDVMPVADHDEAERELRKRWSADSCILVKGSRRAALDKVIANLVSRT